VQVSRAVPTLGRMGESPTTAQLRGIPNGYAGTAQTLRIMRQFARDAIRDPSQLVRLTTLSVIEGVEPRAYGHEVRAVQRWVRDVIHYVQDPVDVELVQTCEKTLELRRGDCDDKSTLLAAMLESIGHPCKFVAVGINGGDFSHVMVQTKVGDAWVWLETILPGVEAGWCPPGITKAYFLKV
jgi:Transglutaminase-like superfamily